MLKKINIDMKMAGNDGSDSITVNSITVEWNMVKVYNISLQIHGLLLIYKRV